MSMSQGWGGGSRVASAQGGLSAEVWEAVQAGIRALSPDDVIARAFAHPGALSADRDFGRNREACTHRVLTEAASLQGAEQGRIAALTSVAALALEAADDLASLHAFLQVRPGSPYTPC
jgi:hypothetical protein